MVASTARLPLSQPARGRRQTRVRYLLFPSLAALLALALLLNAGIGAVRIAPLQSLAILLDNLGVEAGVSYTQQQDAVLWAIRIPRMLLAALVGASLGLARR
jgi:iron complex transport system permease protein